MLNRRELMVRSAQVAAGGLVTLVFTPLVAGCGSSTGDTASPTPTPTPVPTGCDGAEETSSVVEAHTHTLCVPASDIVNPAVGGATFTTSFTIDHDHRATFSQAQLLAIGQGQVVTITTSISSSHTHDFAVQMTTPVSTPTTH